MIWKDEIISDPAFGTFLALLIILSLPILIEKGKMFFRWIKRKISAVRPAEKHKYCNIILPQNDIKRKVDDNGL